LDGVLVVGDVLGVLVAGAAVGPDDDGADDGAADGTLDDGAEDGALVVGSMLGALDDLAPTTVRPMGCPMMAQRKERWSSARCLGRSMMAPTTARPMGSPMTAQRTDGSMPPAQQSVPESGCNSAIRQTADRLDTRPGAPCNRCVHTR
jgi:hypothetical protein